MRFAKFLSLMTLSASALVSAVGLAATASAQTPNDSTSVKSATQLGQSVCPNLTASKSWNYAFFRAPPANYYLDARDGSCYPTGATGCTAGFNVNTNSCVKVTSANPPSYAPAPDPTPPPAYVGYGGSGALPTVSLALATSGQVGGTALARWASGGSPMPTGVIIGCFETAAPGRLLQSWPLSGGTNSANISLSPSLFGTSDCFAFNYNSLGKATSSPVQKLTVGCPSGQFVVNGSCHVMAAGFCPSPELRFNGTTCVPLSACPATIRPWSASGPITPLYDTNPSSLTPDGHEWCYYYGRGGDDGGDPWAAAFDRVVGKPVAFYPVYKEVVVGYGQPQPYGHMETQMTGIGDSSSTSSVFVVDGYSPPAPIFGFDNSSFQSVMPVYGTGNVVDGGSKCAPGHSTGLSGYYQAWYPSDCSGHGDSGLALFGAAQYPGAAACVYTLDPSNPIYKAGYRQLKIGGAGDQERLSVTDSQGIVYSSTPAFRYPADHAGCQPGMQSLSSYDPSAPLPSSGSNGM